ncbi:piggyBac transposable element-derived protein 1-like [Engraulis encrasicolus]|uniref:piggyBac transposable element-derived protein 1-like n=1 Tax=Engraulis encrasicolus TaxID=184585 RepID=UPI002FD3F584
MRATKTKKKDPVPTTRIQNPSTSIRGRHAPSSALMRRTKTKKKDTASSTLIQHPSTSSSQSSNFHAPRTTKAKKKAGRPGRHSGQGTDTGAWHEDGWQPSHIPFTATPGPRSAAAELDSDQPADFLELFLTDELLQNIVEQTNLYASQYFEAHTATLPHSRHKSWKPVTLLEIKKFFGLTFLTGYVKKPSIDLYWSVEEVVKAWTVRRRLGEDEVEQTEGEGGGAEGDVDVEGRPNRAPYNTDPDSRLPH